MFHSAIKTWFLSLPVLTIDHYLSPPPPPPADPNAIKILSPKHIFAGSYVSCSIVAAKSPDEMAVLVPAFAISLFAMPLFAMPRFAMPRFAMPLFVSSL